MASDRHDDLDDDLDELDEEPSFEIVVDEPKERKPLNLKPFLIGLLILVLGGGLGAAAYLLTAYDTRDLIGLLDVGDGTPRLSLELPGRSDPAKPAETPHGGGLLTPPGGAASGEMLKALPDDAPPPVAAQPGPETPPALPPSMAAPAVPAAPAGADPAAEALAKLEAGSAPPPPAPKVAPVDHSGMPTQPSPRSADKQPPSFDSLAALKGEVKPLLAAPIKDLLRKTQVGDLPYPAPDGRQPWQVYARPWSGPADKGKVAVVVVDLGLDKAATEAAIAKLPPEVTLAFSPYAGGLDKWVKKARDAGHEVMLMLPSEPVGYPARDPGPYGLLVSNTPEENIARLEQVLARAPGAVGVLAPDGAFVHSAKLSTVLMALKERGMIFVADGAKVDVDLPNAAVTAVLDNDLFRDAIEARLTAAARTAKTGGSGVVVVSPRPVAFDRLLGWLDRLGDQGLVLAPATGVVKQSGKS
jgi:polysaccharide deacetylase 2 family uncharacterized protein YibQ